MEFAKFHIQVQNVTSAAEPADEKDENDGSQTVALTANAEKCRPPPPPCPTRSCAQKRPTVEVSALETKQIHTTVENVQRDKIA